MTGPLDKDAPRKYTQAELRRRHLERAKKKIPGNKIKKREKKKAALLRATKQNT